jgi:hypothetical protein
VKRILRFASGGRLVALLAVASSCSARADRTADPEREQLERGEDLFVGDGGLAGRVAGQDDPLPPAAVRCSNCHTGPTAGPNSPNPSEADGGEAVLAYGPAVFGDALTAVRPRRGGPPTRYDETTFCGLLRSGIDPAHIIIARAMPRYTLDSVSCRALWSYVTARGGQ